MYFLSHSHPVILPTWSTILVILFSGALLLSGSSLSDEVASHDGDNISSTDGTTVPTIDQLSITSTVNSVDHTSSVDLSSSMISSDEPAVTQLVSSDDATPPPPQSAPATPTREQQQQQPHLTRNYASNECGSKVIAANPEAEGTQKILDDSMDDYMLSPCRAAEIWFVIELCEPILPSAFEIANFELYSSTFRRISIVGSEKYPTPEWINLGMFEASDSRELQRFTVNKQQSTYIKFIKIDIHSFYGSEHFCPVSLIRAFGLSLVEEESFNEEPPLPPLPHVDVTTIQPNVPINSLESAKTLDISSNIDNSPSYSDSPIASSPSSSQSDDMSGVSVDQKSVSSILLPVSPIQPPLEEPIVLTATTSNSFTTEASIIPTPVESLPVQTPVSTSIGVNGDRDSLTTPSLTSPAAAASGQTISHKAQPGQVASPSAPASGSVIAASPSKETIFLKLNNRIKSLEQNMSHSLASLDELSRKVRFIEESLKVKDSNDETTQVHVKQLKSSLELVTERVYLLVSEKEAFHWQLVQVHIVLMVIEIACIIVLMSRYLSQIKLAVSCGKDANQLNDSSQMLMNRSVESDVLTNNDQEILDDDEIDEKEIDLSAISHISRESISLDELSRRLEAIEESLRLRDLTDRSTNSQVDHLRTSLDSVTEKVQLLVSEREAFHRRKKH